MTNVSCPRETRKCTIRPKKWNKCRLPSQSSSNWRSLLPRTPLDALTRICQSCSFLFVTFFLPNQQLFRWEKKYRASRNADTKARMALQRTKFSIMPSIYLWWSCSWGTHSSSCSGSRVVVIHSYPVSWSQGPRKVSQQ